MQRSRLLVAATVAVFAVVAGAGSDDSGGIDLSGPAEVVVDTTAPVDGTTPATGDTGTGDVASGDLSERPATPLPAGATGGGSVTVDGTTYAIDPTICIAELPNVAVEGLGTADDGTIAWVSVNRSVTRREDALLAMGADTVQALFGDRDVLDEISVTVDVGSTGPGSDATTGTSTVAPTGPRWEGSAGVIAGGDLVVEPTDTGVRGSGTATDASSAEGPARTSTLSFDVGCG